MTNGIRTQTEIFNNLRGSLSGKIQTLTNFTTNSFNYVWTQSFAEEFREREIQLTANQLSAWIDYSGGPIDEQDLADLGIEGQVTPEELEEYLADQHLDELVKIVGISRNMGEVASGTVTFTTQSASTTISSGTSVGTQPDSSGDFTRYETMEQVSTESGVTTVDAPVQSVEVGAEYNTGAGTVTYLPNPPGGVQAVTNSDAVEGGEDIESNDELRNRAKDAVFQSSGGGTVQGMIGYIEENTAATEVNIVEYPSGDSVRDYPHGHVIVSGGEDDEVLQSIEECRPASVEHIMERATIITIDVSMIAEGQDIDAAEVEDRIENFLDNMNLDQDLYEDRLIFIAMGADDNISNIVSIDYNVVDEAFFYYPTQDVYEVELGDEMIDDSISNVTGTVNDNDYTFAEDTDYQEWNTTAGDTSTPHNSIDWSIAPSSTTDNISYSSGQTEYTINQDLVYNGITNVENTTTSTTLTEGTDWEVADTDNDDLQDGIRFLNTQSDGDSIDVTYNFANLPDVFVNQSQTETYSTAVQRYSIDEALVEGGVIEVTGTFNGSSHTFTKGIDYEEWDSDGDGQVEGIDWSIGGDAPDDSTTFTVTYDAGTQFLVDYDITDGDITTGANERFTSGVVNVMEAQ